MKYFETHAHYDDDKYKEDVEEVIKKVKESGVDKIVNVSCDFDTCYSSYELSKKYDFIYHTIGVHPYEAKDFNIGKLEEIYNEVNDDKLVAVGEIGLDYSYELEDGEKEAQKKAFIDQINFAKKHNLPIIIHTRDASLDTYEILKNNIENEKVLLHCFSPTDDLVKFALERKNVIVAFGGNITFKRKDSFEKYVNMISIDKIVIETDSPYLSPVPKRGERNDSSNLPIIVKKLSEILNITEEEVCKKTYENAEWFYFNKG